MCGIFGYIGNRDAVQVCLRGLEQLEYRGYDSSGIASIDQGKIIFCKRAGKLAQLKNALLSKETQNLHTITANHSMLKLAIAHTRWATHGKVSDVNAHPQLDASQSLAIIHNGIIENYDSLRNILQTQGIHFSSETDTEVIAQLIATHYKGDLLHALYAAIPLLKGSFALIAIHKDHPEELIAAARECPLSIALYAKTAESMISSDPNTLIGTAYDVMFLENNEIARVQPGLADIYDASYRKIKKSKVHMKEVLQAPSKEGFEHFLLKELFEQPFVIKKMLSAHVYKDTFIENLKLPCELFQTTLKIWILGCGTSANAGAIGSLFFENLARIDTSCEIASEARYRNVLLGSETLVIAISQSGETADTLAAMREIKKRGCKTIGICNVPNSALSRETDNVLFLHAGPEMSVCSTKAFTGQLMLLLLLALFAGKIKKTIPNELHLLLYNELKKIPSYIEQILEKKEEIKKLSEKYAKYDDFLFIGRHYMLPTCMEAALKLKEISYTNANGCPAGELKHGPIALLNESLPVIAFCANKKTEPKMISNLMEVKARGAPVLAIAPQHLQNVKMIANDVFFVPTISDELAPFLSTVASQLFAYYIAKQRGCDIDQPRNLAKSVTVE